MPKTDKEFRDQWKQNDPEGYRASKLRRNIRVRFNFSIKEFEAFLSRCGTEICMVCKRIPNGRGLYVDHDHSCCPGRNSCGKCVRGYICARCNTALGMVEDKVEILRALISYLESHREDQGRYV